MKHINPIRFFLFLIVVLISCDRPGEGSKKAGEHIKNTVVATVETKPVPRHRNEDSADDPAIWIHPADPGKSLIIGTDKKGGMATYNLKGEEIEKLFVVNDVQANLKTKSDIIAVSRDIIFRPLDIKDIS